MRRFGQIIAACLLLGWLARAQDQDPASANVTNETAEAIQGADDQGNPTVFPEKKSARKHRSETRHHDNPVQIRGDIVVKKGETVGDIVVVAGKLKMEGEVNGNIVAVATDAFIDGIVHGTVVVVPGPVKFGPNADVHAKTLVVGAFSRDPAAKFNHFQEVPIPEIVPIVNGAKDYIFQGVLLMRPLPPSLRWVWLVHGAIFIALLGLTVLFPKPVQVGADAIANRPVVSMFSGFLTVILFVPVLLLLVVSVVGIVAVPFAFVGLGLAALFGKAAVLEYLGQQIGRNLRVAFLESPLVALVVGALLLAALYMVPVLGLLIWMVATLLGLGAIMVATASALNNQPTVPTPTGVPTPIGTMASAVPLSDPAAPPVVPLPPAPVYLRRVGFWKRFFASFLDWVLLIIPTAFAHFFIPFVPVLLMGYFVGMWTWKGTTIGGICLGIKVVRTDGTPIDFAVALVRSLASCFSFIILFLGFFWAGWDREKQSWHDKIAGTVVVQVPKGVSLL